MSDVYRNFQFVFNISHWLFNLTVNTPFVSV